MRTRNLLKFIRNLREDKLCLEECVNLLLDLQLNRGPIIETITVIQHEKPLLFSWLKSRLSFRPGLLMMLDVRME